MPRTFSASRRALPFAHWPKEDQDAWQRATAGGDLLDEQGPAYHWAVRTKSTNQQHYARWLGYLAWQSQLSPDTEPGDRISRATVRAYHEHLTTIVAPRTVLSMLVGLKVCLQTFEPDRSWRWLQDLCNRVQRTAEPTTDKRQRIRDSAKIFSAALAELQLAEADEPGLKDAIRYRDALMLALLTARPIRVKNMTSIKLNQHLVPAGDQWLLVFPTTETKNKEHLEYHWPVDLLDALEAYLNRYRPIFPDAVTSDRLWLNQYGDKLGPNFVYYRVVNLTQRLFDQPINPHLLRDCAASSLAKQSTEAARSAKALLGHKYFSTTERYYVQADNLEASRRLNDIFDRIEDTIKDA